MRYSIIALLLLCACSTTSEVDFSGNSFIYPLEGSISNIAIDNDQALIVDGSRNLGYSLHSVSVQGDNLETISLPFSESSVVSPVRITLTPEPIFTMSQENSARDTTVFTQSNENTFINSLDLAGADRIQIVDVVSNGGDRIYALFNALIPFSEDNIGNPTLFISNRNSGTPLATEAYDIDMESITDMALINSETAIFIGREFNAITTAIFAIDLSDTGNNQITNRIITNCSSCDQIMVDADGITLLDSGGGDITLVRYSHDFVFQSSFTFNIGLQNFDVSRVLPGARGTLVGNDIVIIANVEVQSNADLTQSETIIDYLTVLLRLDEGGNLVWNRRLLLFDDLINPSPVDLVAVDDGFLAAVQGQANELSFLIKTDLNGFLVE